jgi:heme-degrading protein
MTKLGIGIGVLATVSRLSVGAQTIDVTTLDQAGAQMVLQAAKASAQQSDAPSAIAVVDPAGDLLAFKRMDGVRPASADLAIGKARTAARLQRPTEDNINQVERHRQHRGAARRHADTRSGRSRGRGRHSWLEQGHGRGHRQHRSGSAGFLAGDRRAALRELLIVWPMPVEDIGIPHIRRPGRDSAIVGRAGGELRCSPRSSIPLPQHHLSP